MDTFSNRAPTRSPLPRLRRRRAALLGALVPALGLALGLLGSGTVSAGPPPPATTSGQTPALPYGVDTCLQGYVWREAVPGDHVCVTPDVRSQAAYDNSQAASRTVLGAAGTAGPATNPSPATVISPCDTSYTTTTGFIKGPRGQCLLVSWQRAATATDQTFSVSNAGAGSVAPFQIIVTVNGPLFRDASSSDPGATFSFADPGLAVGASHTYTFTSPQPVKAIGFQVEWSRTP